MSQFGDPLGESKVVSSNYFGCQGCSAALAIRYILKALGEKTTVVLPAYCWSAITHSSSHASIKTPVFHRLGSHEVREAAVLAWAGKGKIFDIGLQWLIDAAKRNEDLLYVCYDNESYIKINNQKHSDMPFEAVLPNPTDIIEAASTQDIMTALTVHKIPYAATATIAYPEDVVKKIQKAKHIVGTRFIHVLAPCSPGWRMPAELAMTLARLAVKTCLFPLYEVEEGQKYTINLVPENLPVREYLDLQGRFNQLTDSEIQQIQDAVDAKWAGLQKRASHRV